MKICTILLVILFLAVPTIHARADSSVVILGAGSWETFRDKYREGEFDLTWRSSQGQWGIKPQIGLMVTGNGDLWGGAGLLYDISWSDHWITSLAFAAGAYNGDRSQLGSTLEFRSGVDVFYKFDDDRRLGINFTHMSNAGLAHLNGGSESLLFNYAIPVGF